MPSCSLHPPALCLKTVEHPCYQCHSVVPDTSAFCPNCRVPQIRLSAREYASIPVLVVAGIPHPTVTVEVPHSIDQSNLIVHRGASFRAAMNAGIVAAVISVVPLRGLAFLALPLTGFLCVFLYRRYDSAVEPTPALGFRLGVWTGLVGFVLFVLIEAMLVLSLRAQGAVHDQIIELLRQAQATYSDPKMRQSAEQFMTGDGLIFFMLIASVLTGIFWAVLAGISGAVSAVLLRRKSPLQ